MLRSGNKKVTEKQRLRTAAFDCKTVLRERTSRGRKLVPDAIHLNRRAIDGGRSSAEDGGMSTTAEFTAPRRSARVFRKMKMQAQGRAHNGKKFREVCETLVVSAYGGLLMLKHEVDKDELLVITNPETQEEIECRIVYLGDLCDQGQRVAIEFLTPAPHFWGLEFSDQVSPRSDPPVVH
jgi:hypothetical protein